MKKTQLPVLLFFLLAAGCGDNLTVAPDRQPYQPQDLAPLSCLPNLDGKIEAKEILVAIGVPVSYLISPAGEQRAVELAGQLDSGGHRIWDWGADYASDQALQVTVMSLSGMWYASLFPTGQFASCFDAGCKVHAVYALQDPVFTLLGLVSASQNPTEGQTQLVYNPPVALYQLPLEPGHQWVSVGEIKNGVMRGLPYAGRDTYQVNVDAAGKLILPDLTFTQVLRVRTRTVVEPAAGQSTSQRQVSFMFECFGEVARATSALGEPEDDFTTAIEVRRFGI